MHETSRARTEGISMLDRLLGRSKAKPKPKSHDPLGGFEVDDSIDLESGTIYIDDRIDEDRIVATSQVFEDAALTDERIAQTKIAGGGGKVFAFDMRPFFRAIGTKAGERSADTFTRFCENWLSRAVGKAGAYEFDGLEFFFFKLDLPNDEAVNEAIEIINEIGLQYLRGAFNADLVPQSIVPLDADKAVDEATGKINRKMAFDALAGWKTIHGKEPMTKERLFAISNDRVDEAVTMIAIEVADRPAAARIQRGPDRRRKVRKVVKGEDRRKRKRGRRAADDTRNGAAWA
jgi:hypothetical protein